MGLPYFWIALGAAVGGVARYTLAGIIAAWTGATFPWGTLVVNITGCFAIGVFSTLTGPDGVFLVPASVRLFVMVGMCGGYTTFSSFSLELLNLVQNGEWLAATIYVMASAIFCLIGVWIGHVTGVLVNR